MIVDWILLTRKEGLKQQPLQTPVRPSSDGTDEMTSIQVFFCHTSTSRFIPIEEISPILPKANVVILHLHDNLDIFLLSDKTSKRKSNRVFKFAAKRSKESLDECLHKCNILRLVFSVRFTIT
jgi:hypothetical protein